MLLVQCRATKYVPEGKYLLKDNKLKVEGDEVNEDEALEVIRQQPNLSSLGIKFRLIAYNMVRPAKAEKSRLRRLNNWKQKNARRKIREDRINARKIRRAVEKGDSTYYKRTIQLKDTANPRLTIRERIKYKFGEAPVIVDSFLFEKSQEQLKIYFNKKGYFYNSVSGVLDTLGDGRKQKIKARYAVTTGERYYIDSLVVVTTNSEVRNSYTKRFLRKTNDKFGFNEKFYAFLEKKEPFRIPFDEDQLDAYRTIIAKAMKDDAFYGFSPQHIRYRADTVRETMSITLKIIFTDRTVKSPIYKDSLIQVKHRSTIVSNVYFHISDTTMFEANFKQYYENKFGEVLNAKDGFLPTVDTMRYAVIYRPVENRDDGNEKEATFYKSAVHKNLFGKPKDSLELNPLRMATFYYNGELFVKPGLIEAQNYLEYTNPYKDYYYDRTYNRLLQLGLFSVIKPEIIEEVPGSGEIEVHYYLVPAKKQSYSFEPRATNSNGFLGVSATVNYTNKNLFRSGWLTTVSLSGGFESQPPVFDETIDGQKVQKSGRSFNTFEIGPALKFDLPGFFPINVTKLPKRARPRTVLSTAYNYQRRPDFTRGVFQMNFLWKLYVGKTQIISAGVPLVSVIKYVGLTKSAAFEERITKLNDLFLRNAYSDQLIWEDFKLVFDYDNRDKDDKKTDKLRLTGNATFNLAGNTLSMGKSSQDVDTTGRRMAFGVVYSQFFLFDSKLITYYNFSRQRILAFRGMVGIGIPYGNTPTSLPYDYSFFAGGANDNRGFVARALGPGSYKYYMDTNRTATQIGDIRYGASLELRLGSGFLKSAFFMDVGNIWTLNEDVNRPGSKISNSWYRELGLALGYGLRLDFEFFIVRCDLGIPFTNPALPQGARWIFQSRQPYIDEINTLTEEQRKKISAPFSPRLNIGIGFPF
ncbi:MAG TPA: BamA/TamA family outer membrane protein [Fluviicola sp.]|nr:BamA/TamA family outer membrane protein [Fluviicola sp.]